MITRREILQVGAATAALMAGGGGLTRALAQQRVTEAELLKFDTLGNVTLLHVADIHGQLVPVYFREPSINLGVGAARGQPPHLTGADFLKRFGIPAKSAAAYALTSEDFAALAKSYGRIGGLDRLASVVKRVRAERGDKVLLLDGGDTWQGSMGANVSKGQDMVDCMALLKPDAMTGHWEFTLGTARVKEIVKQLGFPFLAQNVRDTEWDEPAFEAMRMVERGGVKIAIIGQALPYTAIANPRWMIPNWSFGIRENDLIANVGKARKDGAQLVVLLSHNGGSISTCATARSRTIATNSFRSSPM
jgi:sulfur-oxidizing protein SoxB